MGMGRFEGFFVVAIPEAEGPLEQVKAMRKTDKNRRLLFCADVDDAPLSLFALAMPLGSCSRENRLFGI